MKMNKMVRFAVSIVLTIVLAFSFTACSSKNAGDKAASADITAAPTAAAAADTTTDTTTDTTQVKQIKDTSEYEPTDGEPSADETWDNSWNEAPVVVEEEEDILYNNWLKNPSFEDGADTRVHTDWQTDNETVSYTESNGGAKSGTYHLTHWSGDSDFEANTWQTIEVPNGIYNISAFVQVLGDVEVAEISAKDYDGTNETVVSTIDSKDQYTKAVIENVEVKDGKLTVNFHTKAKAGGAIFVDDVKVSGANLVKNASFEDGADTRVHTDWQTDNDAISYTESNGGAHTGTYHLTHWTGDSDYEVNTWQTLEVPNGVYNVSAYVQVLGDVETAEFIVKDNDASAGTVVSTKDDVDKYTRVEVANVEVKNGKLTVQFHTKGKAGSAIFADDVSVNRIK
ncbi:MAG TPA: hypothetical protein VN258_00565 [Mobilitalea sp.]|nr:hypothetical protein [Mobilitalea sp.]